MTNPSGQSYLEQFTVDLTELAKKRQGDNGGGKLDPIIGRHEEIRRCLQILGRRQKNNPILIGQGKFEIRNIRLKDVVGGKKSFIGIRLNCCFVYYFLRF